MAFEYASFVMRNPAYVTKDVRNQWSVRKAMLAYRRAHPACEATGSVKRLEVHHVIPVSVAPNLAGVESNFMVLTRTMHRAIGHADDFKNAYVPNVRRVAEEIFIQRTTGAKIPK